MIHTITAKNYQSIAEETTLSFEVNRKASEHNNGYANSDIGSRLSLVQAIIGGNASGKTTMLKAIALINWLFSDSFRYNQSRGLPVKGFAGSEATLNSPTVLSVTYELGGVLQEYTISLTQHRILNEELRIRALTSERVTTKKAFSRQWSEETKSYAVDDNYFGLKEPYWGSAELGNTSVIAAATRFGNERALELLKYWQYLKTNIEITDRFMPYQYRAYRALSQYEDNVAVREQAEADVRRYDLGIQSFGKDGTILHRHGESTFELEIDEESSGTQQFIGLKDMVYHVLQNGGIAIIDELNAYLHPLMSEAIIKKFLDPEINTAKGQLLFSTHDLQVFEMLDKYQISLAEKDQLGVTSIKRFDTQPRLRPTDNYIKKYLAGVYGGINKFN